MDRAASRERRSRSPTSTRTSRCPRPRSPSPGAWSRSWAPASATWCSGSTWRLVEGMCGVVEDGILPGLFGYEAGQSGVGDIFAWFVENAVPPEYHELAAVQRNERAPVLEDEAAALRPGESGLLALDWWNGNRSVLVDVDLTGLLVGATLATKAPEIYRALIEATAFGTRAIVEAFEAERRRGERDRGLRRPAGAKPAPDADLRRRDRPRVQGGGVEPDARAGLGHVRGGGGRSGTGRLRQHRRGRGRRWPGCSETSYRPEPGTPRGLRRAVSRSTARCTTTSAAARTT